MLDLEAQFRRDGRQCCLEISEEKHPAHGALRQGAVREEQVTAVVPIEFLEHGTQRHPIEDQPPALPGGHGSQIDDADGFETGMRCRPHGLPACEHDGQALAPGEGGVDTATWCAMTVSSV